MEFRIMLNSVEDAVRFVNTLGYHNYQADAVFETFKLDARSLLGILGYGIGRVITILLYEEPDEDLCYFMKEYAAA